VRGVEALVRWQHPKRGLLVPDEFIPMAEHTDLIRAFTRAVLRESLRQASVWLEDGIELRVAVNISARNRHHPSFSYDVADLLGRTGVQGCALELEITESTVMAEPNLAIQSLAQLADMGVRIAIDDYGTGYSSLAYLQRLPVHALKIDKSFVTKLGRDTGDATIVHSTVELGHNLGLEVIAEGVEDQHTWDALVAFGCDVVQGYHVATPLPGSEIPAWLARRAHASESALA
jgi:EAL domain-containing protein (putative c-di-GMP-specific phosphodiesterase class I)